MKVYELAKELGLGNTEIIKKLNDIGIKTVNYQLMLETLIKVIILAIAFLI